MIELQLALELNDRSVMSCTVQMWGVLACFKQNDPGGFPDYHIAKESYLGGSVYVCEGCQKI